MHLRTAQAALIAVVNRSTLVSDSEVLALLPPLHRQVVEHYKPAWGLEASLVLAEKRLPGSAMLLEVLDTSDEAGALGYHLDAAGRPVTRVFAKEAMADHGSISAVMSHEILEMLADPAINLAAIRPARGRRPEWIYAYEVCDPVQGDTYEIDGVRVSNFVYPEWFEANWAKDSRRFDHMKLVRAPFELRPGGYVEVRQQGASWTTLWGGKPRPRLRHRPRP